MPRPAGKAPSLWVDGFLEDLKLDIENNGFLDQYVFRDMLLKKLRQEYTRGYQSHARPLIRKCTFCGRTIETEESIHESCLKIKERMNA